MMQNSYWLRHGVDMLNNPNAHSVGLYGETIVREVLSQKGYEVVTPQSGVDLQVIDPETGEILGVEVKTSRRGKHGWQFTLWKKGSQNHHLSDIVILLAHVKVGLPVAFVIPTKHIRDLHSIKIASHPLNYDGKYARFRQELRKLSLGVL